MQNNDTIVVANWLRDKGFDLLAIMDPMKWSSTLTQVFASLNINIPGDSRVVLIGSAGPRLWDIVSNDYWQKQDPIDQYSIRSAEELVDRMWKGESIQWLYPGPKPVPLQRLSRFAGWSHQSLLGLDIHPTFGTWFACRAAFIIELPIPCTPRLETSSPCDDCLDKPCRTQCPSGAVRERNNFGLSECGSYRVADESRCSHQCIARLSCPAGSKWRYADDQLAYHGALSLAAIKSLYAA